MIVNGIDVQHLPITLRNELICKAAFTKAKEYAHAYNLEAVLRNLARLRKRHPELAELVDELGMLNATTLDAFAQRLKDNHHTMWMRQQKEAHEQGLDCGAYEPMDTSAAIALAKQELDGNLRTFLKDNTAIGKEMYFDMDAFPETIDALKIGIEIIKETFDASKLTVDEQDAIKSEITSDYWSNVAASEVAAYVTNFCKSFK